MCPLMDPAIVQIVGDSISEGSPLNQTYRRNATAKDRMGMFGVRLMRDFLGTSVEVSGNLEGGSKSSDVISLDLASPFWTRAPKVLLLHVGVNDNNGIITWSTYSANLATILAACVSNHCTLVLTDIFPYTGTSNNSDGTDTEHRIEDTWNANLVTWAATNGVRLLSATTAIGQARTVAKSGDPTPPAGNLWDLQTAYMYTGDGLGST